MEINNNSVYSYYKKDWVHPEFVPYLRSVRTDTWKNKVDVNLWSHQGAPQLVDDQLVRINKGMSFQRMWDSDPCPVGWKKAPNHIDDKPSGFCEKDNPPFESVFYTDRAFIASKQNFDGYTKPNRHAKKVMNARSDNQPRLNMTYSELQPTNVSDTFDMRSVSPFSGKYQIFFNSKPHHKTRYINPNAVDGLRGEWYRNEESYYGSLPTSDSYL